MQDSAGQQQQGVQGGSEAFVMGHFRVAVCLGFEVNLGAQLLKGK